MAKKRFIDNFESLFGDPLADAQPQERSDSSGKAATKKDDIPADSNKKPKASGKKFSDSLQSFLSDSFEESFERQMAETQKKDSSPTPTPRKKRRRSGLDFLIRSTVEPSNIEYDDQPKRKRLTLTFEPQKLEKLKSIAKVERAMLKDIIDEIVGDYISKYETEKGSSK